MERIRLADTSLWEAFYWVCKLQNFSRAAKRMGISPPFLSKKIQKLEEEMAVRFFQRSTRRVAPTTEALELLPAIESLLTEWVGIEQRFSDPTEIAGWIRLTTLPAFGERWLAPHLVAFQAKYPKVRFKIHLSDQLVDLIDSQLDLAVRVQKPTGADFVFRRLFANQLIFCASPDYLKRKGKPTSLESLARHEVLMLGVYENTKILGSGETLKRFRESQPILSESGSFLSELAVQGAGIAVRSYWDVAPLIREGKLVRVLRNVALEPFGEIFAVTPHRKQVPPRVRQFLKFLEEISRDFEKTQKKTLTDRPLFSTIKKLDKNFTKRFPREYRTGL